MANPPVNQYLFYLLKALVRFDQKGTLHEDLTKEDYAEISAKTNYQLTVSTLVKMYTDPSRYKWGDKMLALLCHALPSSCIYWNNYKLFFQQESDHYLYDAVLNQPFHMLSKDVIRDIKKKTTKRVLEILTDAAPPQASIPITNFHNNPFSAIKVASREDVEQIYENARNRYGDCDLNPPAIKLRWKKINEKIFYVIHDSNDVVKANINLLPISYNCFNALKAGHLEEKDISPGDIMPLTEQENVRHIYVEGLNCHTREQLIIFGQYFHQMVFTLATPGNNLTISAIGGTIEGEKLMHRLGFRITGKYMKGNYDFFEVPYEKLYQEIESINHRIF